MSRALKLGCALVVLGCLALVAYYGLNRGIYIGSDVQPVASGPNVFWIKTSGTFLYPAEHMCVVCPMVIGATNKQVTTSRQNVVWVVRTKRYCDRAIDWN